MIRAYYDRTVTDDVLDGLAIAQAEGCAYWNSTEMYEALRVYIDLNVKWDRTAETTIRQIKKKGYAGALPGFSGEVLLVGVRYDRQTRQHEAQIESPRKDSLLESRGKGNFPESRR